MVQENATPIDSKGSAGDEDLSAEIALTVEKRSVEQVTCRRVTRNHYRCNWWAPENSEYANSAREYLLVTTSRICKSRFLHVTKSAQGLKITVISPIEPVVADDAPVL